MKSLPLIAVLTCLALPAIAQEAPGPRLFVTGAGQVEVAPDMATITLGVVTEAPGADDAMAANSRALAEVIQRLTLAGVAARDIQTSSLSVSPQWTRPEDRDDAPRIAGYRVQNMVTVRIRDLELLGGVLDSVVQGGANQLVGLTLGIADPHEAMNEARRRAVADAIGRAQVLAQASGVKLGPIVSISEGGSGMPQPMFKAEAAFAGRAMDVPIAAGELTVEASVSMSWQIEQ
ncbi:hypothetical protein LV82_02420 [Albidovulum inexpectatum]|uniref:Secreted protein n=1 Tax=Albidovulum inexpectatum TaxID=196587 RepID=A0A2S5JEG6_9RHOB|nr:SIMPL domain-containing protein [Albidovulum inexpectatum]PPB79863.1 hypothetical protein LV82_02420 [Albidovulum inexpectatum]